jgi:hypothetical protein
MNNLIITNNYNYYLYFCKTINPKFDYSFDDEKYIDIAVLYYWKNSIPCELIYKPKKDD